MHHTTVVGGKFVRMKPLLLGAGCMEMVLGFGRAWVSPVFRSTALKVSMIVGSVLFVVNHGAAAIEGAMTIERWLSAAVTYLVPYTVSVHGQFVAKLRQEAEDGGESINPVHPTSQPPQVNSVGKEVIDQCIP
jgi:hypothetical protein